MSIDVATDQPAGDLLQRVEKVIDIIRPAIQADDGDIVLHGVDEATGEVVLDLQVTQPGPDGKARSGERSGPDGGRTATNHYRGRIGAG